MVCGRKQVAAKMVAGAALRSGLAASIESRHPGRWRADGRVCRPCIATEQTAYLVGQLEQERGALTALETQVARKVAASATIAEHLDEQFERQQTPGQRLADAVAVIGGSWPFVLGFVLMLVLWIVLNSILLGRSAFDPYPYILLNLALSCVAAIQAPVIMMSQNRAAARDRLEADEDFRVNLKAELEIAALHEKIDHLIHTQWERMVELQQTQIELLEELREARRP
jgi:uncharacterized membrane protein